MVLNRFVFYSFNIFNYTKGLRFRSFCFSVLWAASISRSALVFNLTILLYDKRFDCLQVFRVDFEGW